MWIVAEAYPHLADTRPLVKDKYILSNWYISNHATTIFKSAEISAGWHSKYYLKGYSMEEVLGRLRRLVNLEINNHNYTIKGFAVRCEISYTEMREIVNGQTSDIKLSTICQICNNSNISFADVFVENESDLQRMINKVTILFENTDRYSVKLLRYR